MITGRPFESRISLDRQPTRQYRVSKVGQFSIAAAVLRRWDLTDGGLVSVSDQERWVSIAPEGYSTDEDAIEYKVSTAGQMTLPGYARHRWGLMNGGSVTEINLESRLLVMPLIAARDMIAAAMAGNIPSIN